MARFLKKRAKAEAQPPGAAPFIGSQKMDKPKIQVFDFTKERFEETEISDIPEIEKFKETATLDWINLDGLHDTELIRHLGEVYNLHPLILDGIANTDGRPKIVDIDEDLFIIFKMLSLDIEKATIRSEQVSFVLSDGYLLSFQEESGHHFDPIRNRLRKSGTRLRTRNLDYLLYRLLDAIVSNYIVVIEEIGQKVEEIEDSLLSNPSPSIMEDINIYKKEINYMAKIIRPARESILHLSRSDSRHVNQKKTKPFLRDLLDLATHALENCETYRTMLNDQLNIYNTNVSSRLNDILKILTIISVIFVPLTFIAGVYGTNFDVLPELHFKYSYFIMLGVMGILAIGMLVYFNKKKWL